MNSCVHATWPLIFLVLRQLVLVDALPTVLPHHFHDNQNPRSSRCGLPPSGWRSLNPFAGAWTNADPEENK